MINHIIYVQKFNKYNYAYKYSNSDHTRAYNKQQDLQSTEQKLNAWQSVSIVTIRTVAMEQVLHKHKLQFNSMFTHTHTSQGYDDRVSISNWFMMSIW